MKGDALGRFEVEALGFEPRLQWLKPRAIQRTRRLCKAGSSEEPCVSARPPVPGLTCVVLGVPSPVFPGIRIFSGSYESPGETDPVLGGKKNRWLTRRGSQPLELYENILAHLSGHLTHWALFATDDWHVCWSDAHSKSLRKQQANSPSFSRCFGNQAPATARLCFDAHPFRIRCFPSFPRAGPLVGWLVSWLVGRSVGWLVGWLVFGVRTPFFG